MSRSFFLSLAVLPSSLRGPVGLAYLLARGADTIADTRLVPQIDRLRWLDLLGTELDLPSPSRLPELLGALRGPQRNAAERELLAHLPACLAALGGLPADDQARIRNLLRTLIHGMQAELRTFPGEGEGRLGALESRADLDRHTYYAAGCVGEFWTAMAMAHRPALRGWDPAIMTRRSIQFGQGLQMTNVLRDLARDLRIGRCYLPREDLAVLGLAPNDLLDPGVIPRLRPLLRALLALTLAHYAEGWTYTLSVPPAEVRMRLACAWPLLIGLRTLERVQRAGDLLDPGTTVKISRPALYAVLLRSAAAIRSDGGLDRYYRALRGRVADALAAAT